MRCRARLLPIVLAAAGAPAGAQTFITGGNIINQVWTPTGAPYIVQGDITVPVGSTLTIEQGVTVLAATFDAQASGVDPARVEVIVNGTLDCHSTPSSPVAFRAQAGGGAGVWYGLRLNAGASATLDRVSIDHAAAALTTSVAGLSVEGLAISSAGSIGVLVAGGQPVFRRLSIAGATTGVRSNGAGFTLDHSLLAVQGLGIQLIAPGPGTTVNLHNSTIRGVTNGLMVETATGGSVGIRGCIIAGSGGTGVMRGPAAAALAFDITHSDVFMAGGTAYAGVAPGAGCISADPLFESPASARLRHASPCIGAGWPGCTLGPDVYGLQRPIGSRCEMGAAEYPLACYANCDTSTTAPILNVQDFACFLTRYAAGDPYANCDSSTAAPFLNVQDFACFLTRYASGC